MFTVNDDLSIHVTRGDIVFFTVTAQNNGTSFEFQPGDVVRIKIYGKKDAENVVLQKDFPVTERRERVEIYLTEKDTKIGGVINKPVDYWYEVELNPYTNPQTIIGYDEDGAKVFKLFPEGKDIPEIPVDPEVVKVMDDELDMTSNRPVENRAIARAVTQLDAAVTETKVDLTESKRTLNGNISALDAEIAVERARIDNLVSVAVAPVDADANYLEVVDLRVGADGKTYGSAGTAVRHQLSLLFDDVTNLANTYPAGNIIPDVGEFEKGYIHNSKDGERWDSETWSCSGFIPVRPSTTYYQYGGYLEGNYAVYDKFKNVIPGFAVTEYVKVNNMNERCKGVFTTPDNAEFYRFSLPNSGRDYPEDAYLSEVADSYLPKGYDFSDNVSRINKRLTSVEAQAATLSDKKVLVLGDSISADAYGYYEKWVTALINDGFLPSDTVNSSQHATGFVARYNNLENDFISRMEAVENKEDFDFVVVFGGINDYIKSVPIGAGETDKTKYFIPAVDYFFDYLVTNFAQARIVVLSPLHTYQKWENSAGSMQEEYIDYIKAVAKSYHLPVLNLTDESGFCPENSAFRKRWTLLPDGYDVYDGVHPNEEYERRFLAPMIKRFLGNFV